MAGGLTPEQISAEMWAPPPTFDTSAQTSASALMSVVGQINGILAGQQANAGVLLAAWACPTGQAAVSANTPYQTWLHEMAGQLTAAATQILTTGAEFAAFRSMTPTPVQFAANNLQYAVLTATNILGINTIPIAMNRLEYAMYCVMTLAAQAGYGAASAPLQALPPLPAPPSSAVPGGGAIQGPISGGMAGQALGGQAMAAAAPLSSVGSLGSALQPLSSSSSLLSQPTNALMSSGSELAQAPSAASGLGSMASAPMSAAPMASGLGSPTAGSGSAGANNGSWYGMPAAGGTVAAALSGGGGAGMGGFGGAGAMAAMRGPGSWASTVNAAPEGNQVVLSRFAEARAASTTPATSGGMGAPGTMMPPRPASAAQQEREGDRTLETAPIPYRTPTGIPMVTGAGGAQLVAGREGQ